MAISDCGRASVKRRTIFVRQAGNGGWLFGGHASPMKYGKAEIVLIKPIEVNKSIFELARELKYANKQIDKLRRELAQLRKDYEAGIRAPEGWAQPGAAVAEAACARQI